MYLLLLTQAIQSLLVPRMWINDLYQVYSIVVMSIRDKALDKERSAEGTTVFLQHCFVFVSLRDKECQGNDSFNGSFKIGSLKASSYHFDSNYFS